MNCLNSSGISEEFQKFHLFLSFSSNCPWLQWNSTGIPPERWKDFLVGCIIICWTSSNYITFSYVSLLFFTGWSKRFFPSIITLWSFISTFGRLYTLLLVLCVSFSNSKIKSLFTPWNLIQLSDSNLDFVLIILVVIDIYFN